MEKIVALCRRRGFIFGSSEIYGGIAGFWDYGPLGCELKRNVKEAWWQDMVRNPPPGPGGAEYQMVGVDCSIIMNPKVWEASGHVAGFADPMVACKAEGCRGLFRADQVLGLWVRKSSSTDFVDIITADRILGDARHQASAPLVTARSVEELLEKALATREFKKADVEPQCFGDEPRPGFKLRNRNGVVYAGFAGTITNWDALGSQLPCPNCSSVGSMTEPRAFNLMFETHTGALQDSSSKVYLRPETAQGIFANFQNVMDTSRVKIPFGIAQIGKAFRNEITPRNYTFRSREFEQMEIEFFCKPAESMKWYEFWRDVRLGWYESLGIKSGNLRPRQQGKDELAHYSSACTDIEYLFPFSDEPQELEGVAHRGSFDLEAHGLAARGKKEAFAVIDDVTKERYVPHVIEPSAGADRFTLAVLTEAYTVDENRASPEFMRFHPRLAPIKAAVFPLVAKDGLPEIAEPIFREIKKRWPAQYDAKQSIGKRYARMDEAGTPFCFTIDGQSKEDGTVTVRNRDDASQQRIDKSRCVEYLTDQLGTRGL
jgi:glycyl-tRNA synthetase